MMPRTKLRTSLHCLLLAAVLGTAGLFVWNPTRRGHGAGGGHDSLRPIILAGGVTIVLLLSATEGLLYYRGGVAEKIFHLRPAAARSLQLSNRESRFVTPLSGQAPNDDEGIKQWPKQASAAPAKTKASSLQPFAGKTVLIADDDFDITHTLVLRFEYLGITALRTSDALQLLFGVHKVKPDLVVLDVNMPTGNGLAVCEMLNSDEGLAGLPVIIYTGCSTDEVVQRCRALGAHYVLKAPNSWTAIEEILYRLFAPVEEAPARTDQDLLETRDPKGSPEIEGAPRSA